jgi:quinohemoprotein amine dehydrogenase
MPAGAGPNPERRYGTNNAGELEVTATVSDGAARVKGSARLIVTVQRWNDPPIR